MVWLTLNFFYWLKKTFLTWGNCLLVGEEVLKSQTISVSLLCSSTCIKKLWTLTFSVLCILKSSIFFNFSMLCVCITCLPGVHRGQRRETDPPELELQVMSSHVSVGNSTCVLCKNSQWVLLTTERLSSPITMVYFLNELWWPSLSLRASLNRILWYYLGVFQGWISSFTEKRKGTAEQQHQAESV